MTSADEVRQDYERHLSKYLLRHEKVVVATHRHWAAIAEPFLTATVGLLAVGAISASLSDGAQGLVEVLLVAWLVLLGRAGIALWEWSQEWFVATDRRLLLIYGFIIRKVDMLPMTKVTDMTFHRSIVGRLLGYGTFVLESAGQDQALSDLHFIPRPNDTYLKIVGTIFQREGDEDLPRGEDFVDDGPDGDEFEESYVDGRYGEDDPTGRPALREEIAGLGRSGRGRSRERRGHPATSTSTASHTGPVNERRRRSGEATYSETLYSSFDRQNEPEDPDALGPLRWWHRR